MIYKMSVTDFAIPSPKLGSIDYYSGLNAGNIEGIAIHNEIQAEMKKKNTHYKSEVETSFTFSYANYKFKISGRMDGFYELSPVIIEEIKSAFDINKLEIYVTENDYNHPYCLQLLTYGYIYWLQFKQIPILRLLLVSSRNHKTKTITINLNPELYECWLQTRLAELANEVKENKQQIRDRKVLAKQIQFPFSSFRVGQKEIIDLLEKEMEGSNSILIQASTGIGKTLAVLYPTLINALSLGKKVIYVTPKNSQHAVAEDAVNKLNKSNVKIKSLTISAKTKLCLKPEPIYNLEYCEYAKNHFTKIHNENLINKLKLHEHLHSQTFKAMGLDHQVCPYDLQMQSLSDRDVIICDYNYAFSPQAAKSKVYKVRLGEKGKPNLVIDELHNLPARAMSYYSPTLSETVIKGWLKKEDTLDRRFSRKFKSMLKESIEILNNLNTNQNGLPEIISSPPLEISKFDDKLNDLVLSYVGSDSEIGSNDIILAFYRYWHEFLLVLKCVDDFPELFCISSHVKPASLKITCCDASHFLKKTYTEFSQIIGFSATLKPFNFYYQLSGFEEEKVTTGEFVSSFDKINRKIVIIPQVSTKYKHRDQSYNKVIEIIKKITQLQKGNYLVFFPSFEYLENVYDRLPDIGFKIFKQTPSMDTSVINGLLTTLQENVDPYLIFAVQGGSLSEGVDYPGKMIIGAFIIGPALPHYNWEREHIRKFYHQRYGDGYNFAYVYPAMAKSIQAAGRVIRSEQDKGIIVLVDSRFVEDSFSKCMPKDWFLKHPTEIVSRQILLDIKEFWNEAGCD